MGKQNREMALQILANTAHSRTMQDLYIMFVSQIQTEIRYKSCGMYMYVQCPTLSIVLFKKMLFFACAPMSWYHNSITPHG
jgi:hypothetical protein